MNKNEPPEILDPEENWIKTYWRPAMGWQYLVVCLFDFFFAPILTGWYSWFAKIPYEAWKPITMGEGGFYHMAMAAIVGVVAWTRGQEKVTRVTEVSKIEETKERRNPPVPVRYDPKDPSIPPEQPNN
jgi:hypothetical protein